MKNSENNKRIAKNTALLYFRLLITMAVSLFTVRVVLNTLGAVDYGLYNVVGGIVVMFSFLGSTMASASQRFFAFELGKKNLLQLKKTFSMTLTIYIMIAVLILLIAETVGLWFLNTQMNIPEDRMDAARWVFQFSVLTFMMTMYRTPYNSAIIAHEKMNMYAYVSIFEVTLKLILVYMLTLFNYDKLKLYSILIFGLTSILSIIYRTYCKRTFDECKYSFYWNADLFKELVSYSGWNIIGSISVVLKDQGINILLNIFFNPVVNAARAIAYRINTSILQFTNNFYMAVRPQIIKSYASGNSEYMKNLVSTSAKISFFLLFILTTPILLETHYIMSVWLVNIPDFAILFTQLVIINSLIDVLNIPLVTAIQATGKIKLYQTTVTLILLLNLPLSYFFLQIGYPPETTMYVSITISLISFIPRLIIFQNVTKIPALFIFNNVIFKITITSISAMIIPLVIHFSSKEGFIRLIFVSISDIFISIILIYVIGLTKSEKSIVDNLILNKYTFIKTIKSKFN